MQYPDGVAKNGHGLDPLPSTLGRDGLVGLERRNRSRSRRGEDIRADHRVIIRVHNDSVPPDLELIVVSQMLASPADGIAELREFVTFEHIKSDNGHGSKHLADGGIRAEGGVDLGHGQYTNPTSNSGLPIPQRSDIGLSSLPLSE